MFSPTPKELMDGGMPEWKLKANTAEVLLKARYAPKYGEKPVQKEAMIPASDRRTGTRGFVDGDAYQVAKAGGQGQIAFYDGRLEFVCFADIADIADGKLPASALAAIQSPPVLQAAAIRNPQGIRVRKSQEPGLKGCFDENHNEVGVIDEGKVHPTSKAGDIGLLDVTGKIFGYARAEDVQRVDRGAGSTTKPSAPGTAAAPGTQSSGPLPTLGEVTKAKAVQKSLVATPAQRQWAEAVLDRRPSAVRKSTPQHMPGDPKGTYRIYNSTAGKVTSVEIRQRGSGKLLSTATY